MSRASPRDHRPSPSSRVGAPAAPPRGGQVRAARHRAGLPWPTWVKEVNPFDVGDELDAPGRPRVVATPGHTAGHVSFHLPSPGVLISGDSLTTLDPITGARGPQVINDVVNSDPALTRASLAPIEAIDADTLLPGHGDPWRGGMAEAVARARAADAGG